MEKVNVPVNRDELRTRYGCSSTTLRRWIHELEVENVIPDIHKIKCFTPKQGAQLIEVLDNSGVVKQFCEKKRRVIPYQINQF